MIGKDDDEDFIMGERLPPPIEEKPFKEKQTNSENTKQTDECDEKQQEELKHVATTTTTATATRPTREGEDSPIVMGERAFQGPNYLEQFKEKIALFIETESEKEEDEKMFLEELNISENALIEEEIGYFDISTQTEDGKPADYKYDDELENPSKLRSLFRAVMKALRFVFHHIFDTDTLYTSTAHDHAKTLDYITVPCMFVGGIIGLFYSTTDVLLGIYAIIGSVFLIAIRRQKCQHRMNIQNHGYKFTFIYAVLCFPLLLSWMTFTGSVFGILAACINFFIAHEGLESHPIQPDDDFIDLENDEHNYEKDK